MHILISGGTGFIGSALTPALLADGHHLTILSRQPLPTRGAVRYVTSLETLAQPVDAVINLAGASIAGGRWTKAYKRQLLSSRLDTTTALLGYLQRAQPTPGTLLSASAVGYYGDRGDEVLNEHSPPGTGFASDLCQRWEQLAANSADCGVRYCALRFGVVLDRDGGALVDMAKTFRLGVGNWMGSGDQWLSWVHRVDVVNAIRFLLQQHGLSGAFNITAPQPVTGREFARELENHFKTLVNVPIPAPFLRLLLGEMAEELLLASQRVMPEGLQAAGFEFRYPQLQQALDAIY